jgi:hypothetical protein
MLFCRQSSESPVWAKSRSSRSKSAGLSVMLFTARLTAASTRLSLRYSDYLSIGPVNFAFGSEIFEHEQQVCGNRVPVARLRSSSTSMRSGALRSRDSLGSASSISESSAAAGLARADFDI